MNKHVGRFGHIGHQWHEATLKIWDILGLFVDSVCKQVGHSSTRHYTPWNSHGYVDGLAPSLENHEIHYK